MVISLFTFAPFASVNAGGEKIAKKRRAVLAKFFLPCFRHDVGAIEGGIARTPIRRGVLLPMPARTAALKPKTARPSPKRDALVDVAEGLFDRYGFHGTGIDRLVQDSGVARMTLYKHFPTKNALVRAVLEHRDERFWAYINDGVAAREQDGPAWLTVFDVLGDWLEADGSQGSLLLRALAEFSGHDVAVAGDAAFRCRASGVWFQERLEAAGIPQATERGWDLALLFEGAVAMTPVVGGKAAAGQARHAAIALTAGW